MAHLENRMAACPAEYEPVLDCAAFLPPCHQPNRASLARACVELGFGGVRSRFQTRPPGVLRLGARRREFECIPPHTASLRIMIGPGPVPGLQPAGPTQEPNAPSSKKEPRGICKRCPGHKLLARPPERPVEDDSPRPGSARCHEPLPQPPPQATPWRTACGLYCKGPRHIAPPPPSLYCKGPRHIALPPPPPAATAV